MLDIAGGEVLQGVGVWVGEGVLAAAGSRYGSGGMPVG
jgi:hypothetical protein